MYIRFTILFELLWISHLTMSQSNLMIDSLKNLAEETKLDTVRIDALNAIIWEIMTSDTLEATRYWKQAMVEAQAINYHLGLANAQFNYGYVKMRLGQMDSARWHFNESHELALLANHTKTIAKALSTTGTSYYYQSNYEDAKRFYQASNASLLGKKEPEARASNALHFGNIYYDQDMYDSAKYHYEEALATYDSIGDQYNYALTLQNVGNIYNEQNNYPRALDAYLHTLRISESIEDSIGIAYVLGNIGNVYNDQNEKELALDFHLRALAMKQKLGMAYSLIYTYYNLGWVYTGKKAYQEAEKYLNLCLQSSMTLGNVDMEAYAHSGLGEIYLDLGQLELAHQHLERAREMRTELGFSNKLAETLSLLGKLSHQRKQYRKAIDYLDQALALGEELNVRTLIRTASQYQADLYADLGDFSKAYQAHVRFKAMDDSIRNDDNTRKITLLESEYEFQKEKDQLAAANAQDRKTQETRLQQQRYYTYASSGGLMAFLLIAFFIYRNYRQKQLANQILAEKNNEIQYQAVELEHKNQDLEELSTFKQGLTDMIAHDMKNPLNVVIGLSEGAPDANKMKQVNQSGKLMLQMVTNMLDVQKFDQSEMKLNLAPHTLLDILVQAKYQVELLAMARSIQFNFQQVSKDIHLSCDREVIMRVLVNLFTNGIKYSDPGSKIKVTVEPRGTRIQISVTDSGKGIQPEDLPYVFDKFWQSEAKKSGQIESTGLGLTFCKIAVDAHHGDISVTSQPAEGTIFSFDLASSKAAATVQQDQPAGLSKSEYLILRESIGIIRETPLYQFVAIEEALNRISLESESIESWKEAVRHAALNWDEAGFERLLQEPETTES